jgi:hypothetical protein
MDFWPSYIARGIVVGLLILGASQPAFASSGTIDATNHYAWSDNGGYVNWNATGSNVTVTDTALTGYIWSAGFGWINLSPTQGGVTNNAGALGGYLGQYGNRHTQPDHRGNKIVGITSLALGTAATVDR